MKSFQEYITEAPDYKAKLKNAENRKRGLKIDLEHAKRYLELSVPNRFSKLDN